MIKNYAKGRREEVIKALFEGEYIIVTKDFMKLVGPSKLKLRVLRSKRRDKIIVDERQRIAKALRVKGYSYPEIGHVMNRDHTSIMHLCRVRK